jgi:SAM-dependent methyltransferase
MNDPAIDRKRMWLDPRPTDVDYLHYLDLRDFIKSNGSDGPNTVLDYGAGISPYRSFFPGADYRPADLGSEPSLYYKIGLESKIPEKDDSFDLILSTQVLEHVENTADYLSECHRLLKPGGKLLLTTHGIWEDHAYPYDFWRWTDGGLMKELNAAGFHKVTVYKLTCGCRGALLLFVRQCLSAKNPPGLMASLLFRTFRFTLRRTFWILYRFCDAWFPDRKIVRVGPDGSNASFYVVLAVVAQK